MATPSRADHVLDELALNRVEITEAVIAMQGEIVSLFKQMRAVARHLRVIDTAAAQQAVELHELRALRAEFNRSKNAPWDGERERRAPWSGVERRRTDAEVAA